jgi:dTDP-4-amino-4,6-dideoxygalactose transaminase
LSELIRLARPSIDEGEFEAVRRVLSTGHLVQGAEVAAFENHIGRFIGSKHAIAVSNCTAALHLTLLALDVQAGDLVIVTSYSWISTANVIELVGAQPVFTDIEKATFNMDPDELATVLRRLMSADDTRRRVKAILVVHTFGLMADMPRIMKIADEYAVPVIEDAACALGAEIAGRRAGTWGRIACFSFHPRKTITTGEGGVAVTNDDTLDNRLRAMRNHGLDPRAPVPDFIMVGFNYRLTDFQAAMGTSQLAKLERILSARARVADTYDRLLAQSEIRTPAVPDGFRHVYQSYVCLLPAAFAPLRASLISALRADGIETAVGTIHMPLSTWFQRKYGYRAGDYRVTDAVAACSLTLPLYESLEEASLRRIVRKLDEVVSRLWVDQGKLLSSAGL